MWPKCCFFQLFLLPTSLFPGIFSEFLCLEGNAHLNSMKICAQSFIIPFLWDFWLLLPQLHIKGQDEVVVGKFIPEVLECWVLREWELHVGSKKLKVKVKEERKMRYLPVGCSGILVMEHHLEPAWKTRVGKQQHLHNSPSLLSPGAPSTGETRGNGIKIP